jgi:hypothetical protein
MLLERNGHLRRRRPRQERDGTGTHTLRMLRPRAGQALAGPPEGDPVFVDSTGRRARVIRRLAYVAAVLCAAYTAVLALSFLGATPFAPRTVLPVPGVPSNEPGTVRETRQPDLPATSASPGTPSASPTQVPGLPAPTPTPAPSGSATASPPDDEPSGTPTTTGPSSTPTSPTGTPTGPSASPSTDPGGTTGSPVETPTSTPGEPGASPVESPTTGADATGTGSATPSGVSAPTTTET